MDSDDSDATDTSVRDCITVAALPEDLAAACTDACRPERCDEATVRPHEEPGVDRGVPGSFVPFEVPERKAEIRALPPEPLALFLRYVPYEAVDRESQVFRYWSTSQDQEDPIYLFTRFMTRDRFQLLLRRIRIFNPADFPDRPTPSEQRRRGQAREGLMPKVYRQVNGWSAHIQETGESFYTPGTGLTVDEAMVRFTGRSTETTTVPNKPTPARQARGDIEAKKAALTPTQRVVTTLVALLPAAGYHVFLDNLFASVRLFRALLRQNIGATGTWRKDGGIDEILVDEKEEEGKGIPWGKVHCIPTKDGELIQQFGPSSQARSRARPRRATDTRNDVIPAVHHRESGAGGGYG
ncbi:hypothetical protein CPLU01_09843 [Colletotrichum plurivorum]|uniref:PiggyBac transposable element-derived protein domain-containing protein n=1 Tax=Colletotrichum plurivorum TaxID=2175906 RepID=A0A8H6NB52_9PEZI|nr:hypothetical protein CPLU01_09843 [Colletotrichum plurivorum]